MCRSQKMLRVTVREDFSYELATDLINDLKTVIEWLDHHFIYSGMVPALLSANEPFSTCRCFRSQAVQLLSATELSSETAA